jgi:hypothetical protein
MIQCAAATCILDVTKFYNYYFLLNFALFHFLFLAFVLKGLSHMIDLKKF